MRHKKILDVFTTINNGRQKVGFRVEGIEKPIDLSPSNIKQSTNVEIIEVEILIGSTIRPEFYVKGEKMIGGKVYYEGVPIIKNFWIECEDSIQSMKKKNATKIISFKKIIKVFSFNRNNKVTVGLDIGEEKAVFISADRFLKLTSLDLSKIHILEGSYIFPEYYNEGENMFEGNGRIPEYCRKSGVVLKNLNLRFIDKVEEMQKSYINSHTSNIGNYYSSSSENDNIYDSRDWLIDAAGTDDPEIMRDVYWNLD